MSASSQILCLLILVLLGGFFSFAEISLAGASKLRLSAMADDGVPGAQAALRIKSNPGRYFSVIQICTNMVAILGGIVGESVFSPYFAFALGFVLPPEAAENTGFVLSFLIITLAFVIFADLFPKRLSMNNPEKNAIRCVRPMAFLSKVLGPLVWFLESISNYLMGLLGIPLKPRDKITTHDILASVIAGGNAGIIAPGEQAVIENVFNLENRPVTTAMTARESVVYVTIDEDEQSVRRTINKNTHHHILVCNEDIDHVIGCIDSKDILRRLLEGKSISVTEQGLVKPVQFVPDTLTLSEILEVFQRSREDFAVVLNEYALVVGVLTLEDVMSTVMGDLVLTPEESQIVERDENSWLVDGATPTVDLIATLELDELPDSQNYETVAGFVMYMLRKIPKRTDRFDWSGYRFEVIDVDANKVDQVLVTRLAALGAARADAAKKAGSTEAAQAAQAAKKEDAPQGAVKEAPSAAPAAPESGDADGQKAQGGSEGSGRDAAH